MQPIRLLIVDDHHMVRTGFERLAADDPQLEVVGSVGSRETALTLLRSVEPDLLLIDLSLQAGSGLELIQDVASRGLSTRMLVVSMHDEKLFAERCLRAGAHGYVCKTKTWHDIRQAILSVMKGHVAVSPEMSQRLAARTDSQTGTPSFELDLLSNRELSIYEALGRGLTVKEIAGKLHLSPKTVESYRDRIRSKLGIGSAPELIRHATVWTLQNAVLSAS